MNRVPGINAVQAQLLVGTGTGGVMWLREGQLNSRLAALLTLAEAQNCEVKRATDEALEALSGGLNHQGVCLEAKQSRSLVEADLTALAEAENAFFLVLDGVTDPRNLGACVRSAAGFGVSAVIVPKAKSAPLNEAAIKTASGAAAVMPVITVTNLARCLRNLQQAGVWVVGTVLDSEQTIQETPLTGRLAIVMGSEGAGIRHNTSKQCDYLASIPMADPSFGFNVSVAAGVCLYEVHRQRAR